MDELPYSHPSTAQDTTQTLEAVRFDHAALLSGRPFYWTITLDEHLRGLERLIRWCLALPGAWLGLAASDIATVLCDAFTASPERLSADVRRELERFGVNPHEGILWPFDREVWAEWQLDKLLDWLRHTSQVSECIWVEPEDADWWLTATMRSIASYARLFAGGVDRELIFRLISRHVCTVFAPFDGAAMLDHARTLTDYLPSEQSSRLREALDDARLNPARLAAIRDVYWSWRLADFGNVDGSIVCMPLLAIWSDWPSSARWAPQTLAPEPSKRQLTGDEMAALLEGTYWQRIETVFSAVRGALGLGVAEPEFADIQSRPPVFFYASPVEPPLRAEDYAETLRPDIMPLVKSCLASTDPLAQEVGWGLLEGHLVALRREISFRQSTQPWYLLLPTSSRAAPVRPLEEDVAGVADRLAYLEFSIGHEARDVYTDVEPLAVRAAMWGGTLDNVNTVMGEAIDLLPSVHKRNFGRINDRLAQIHLVLRRLQANTETAASDASQVERKYDGYLDGTDDYFRRRITISKVSHVTTGFLRDAVQNAYPYQYVKQPLASLQRTMRQLGQEVARISSSLNTVLELTDRRNRVETSRLGSLTNIVIALLALLVGLAQVLGSQSGSAASSPSTASGGLLDVIFQSPELASAARVGFEIVGVLLIAAALYYCAVWIYQRRPRRRHKFIEAVRRLRARVSAAEDLLAQAPETAAEMIWSEVDKLDDEASQILAELWRELRRERDIARGNDQHGRQRSPREARVPGVRQWESRARLLEHGIELFDMLPATILLPRTLCILRFKSTDFNSHTAISDWDFGSSLRAAGFSQLEFEVLQAWLAAPTNQQRIRDWDVTTFGRALKERGVTAMPEKRTPLLWSGLLDSTPA